MQEIPELLINHSNGITSLRLIKSLQNFGFDVLFPKVHDITDSGLKLLRDQEPADLFSTLSDNEKKRCLTTQYTEKFECRN